MKNKITIKKPKDCANSCRNVSQCEDGSVGYDEKLCNNAEETKDYPDDPNDTIDEDYENHLLEQSDNLQHYKIETFTDRRF